MSDTHSLLNDRISAITPSATLGIDNLAKQMKAAGKKVFSFAAGEPDFDTPAHIKEAAARALMEGATKYAPVNGVVELKKAIADKLLRENGLTYDPAQVIVSNGAKHSLYNIFMALCREGEEVIIPSPYWLSYPEMVCVSGGRPVFVPCEEANDFKLTPEQFRRAITPRTKAIVLNSPSNPLGIVYSPDELKALAAVAVERRIFMISDEIYEKLIFDGGKHASVAGFSKEAYDLTILVNGFSKAYSMTGWRLGYVAGPAFLISAMSAFQSHSTSGANTFAQFGGIAALNGPQDCVATMVKAFDERRVYIYDRLCAVKGVTCVRPRGAFYVMPNISKSGLTSMQFAERLLKEHGVAVVPGAPFGSDRHIRFSYACSMDNIREGLDRFETFFKSL